ncbi:citrate synthase 2 [Amycolatopsis jiangsuensis]|uniref:citrate synthase (unknown stereospecificity) n=1 Tax=Amycolatopsis jiangsuensis TaxID=1181879 RepID=A0A840J3K8_9PSEU|nr:citrate synthase 2 [Amycolatopsis jiangsuensis]MBB4688037.1 citrate synthase [Amycolatopsis jiangsuensis]
MTTSTTSKTEQADDGFRPGLEGVVAFHTEIAEPDRDGGALRYRGVDIEDLAGKVTFGDVWGLLVDGRFGQGLPPAEPFPLPVHTGDVRVDVQSALAMLAPIWGFQPLLDITDDQARDQLARASVMALSYIAQSARGLNEPAVPQARVDEASSITERFLVRWRGEPNPDHVKALDAYWVSAAEHGLNASTFTARVIASTGADVAASLSGAIGAMSGPLHGGAPARVLPMIEEVERTGDATGLVKGILDRKERLMGFGHRVYRAEDPRARVLRRTCKELGAERFEVAAALEQAALTELRERRPDHPIETNVEFWAAVILDFAQVPPQMMPSMFSSARTAGWAAHILEQKKTGRLVRPSAKYVGPAPRKPGDVEGWDSVTKH